MRTQAASISQTAEAFEPPATQTTKADPAGQDFAAILQQATGGKNSMIAVKKKTSQQLDDSIEGEQSLSGKVISHQERQAHGAVPNLSMASTEEAHSVVTNEVAALAVLEEDGTFKTDNERSSASKIQPQNPSTDLPDLTVIKLTTPVAVSGEAAAQGTADRRSKAEPIEKGVQSHKVAANQKVTKNVTEQIAQVISSEKAINVPVSQVPAQQNQLVMQPVEATSSSAFIDRAKENKITLSFSQSATSNPINVVATKKMEGKGTEELVTKTVSNTFPSDHSTETIESAVPLKGSFIEIPNNFPTLDGVSGSILHSMSVSATNTGDISVPGSHRSEVKEELAATSFGSTPEAASATLFSADSSMGVLPHGVVSVGPTLLEVGVSSGTHGWLKVRAEMTGAGEVNASLTSSSSAIATRLREDLPALSSYLQMEKLQVNGLHVHSELPTALLPATASAVGTDSSRSAFDGSGRFEGNTEGGASQQNGQSARHASVPLHDEGGQEVLFDSTSLTHEMDLQDEVHRSALGYETGGGWLNVRA